MSSTTPAGWYPDPEREGATRWWDGAQWAPSQEPAAADDRFKPKDQVDAGAAPAETGTAASGGEPSWSPEPYAGPGTAWDGQDPASSTPSWSPAPASTPQSSASAPSWQQQETPSWQQPQQSAPAWGQQQASTPSYGAPQDFSQTGAQQWNSYGTPPKKSRTGLFVGIGAGVLVLLLLLVGGGIWGISTFLSNANQQSQAQGGGGGTSSNGGDLTIGQTVRVTVPVNQTIELQVVLTESGPYTIAANTANDEDPVITLISSTGEEWRDDDGGGYPNSLLEETLDAGTYTLLVEEYNNDEHLEVDVTLNRG